MSESSFVAGARSVSFLESDDEQVVVVPRDDAASKYYSQSEIEHFRLVLAQDAQRMATLLRTMPREAISMEQRYECIGIERFLSHDIAIHTTAAIHAHRDVVIIGQDHLAPEALQRASVVSSQWSRSRAQTLALSYHDQN